MLRLKKEVELRQAVLYVLLIPQNFYIIPFVSNLHANSKINVEELVRSSGNLYLQAREVFRELNLSCLDPGPMLSKEDYFSKDAHWTASWHRKVGVFLSEMIH